MWMDPLPWDRASISSSSKAALLCSNIVITILFCASIVTANTQDQYWGWRVEKIELISDLDINNQELLELIEIHQGDMLTPSKLRRSIRLLYMKGLFRDIKAYAIKEDAGLTLRFELSKKMLIRKISFKNKKAALKSELLKIARFKIYDEYDQQKAKRAEKELANYYQNRGFPKAKVTHELVPLGGSGYYHLKFSLELGEPTMINSFKVHGELPCNNIKFNLKIKTKRNYRFDKEQFQDDLATMRQLYLEGDYFAAQLKEPILVFNQDQTLVDITIPVKRGPKVKVKLKGVGWLQARKLKDKLDWSIGQKEFSTKILENKEKIIDELKAEGYHQPKVEADIARSQEQEVTLTYKITRGMRTTARNLEITGLQEFTHHEIRDQMSVMDRGFLSLSKAGFSMDKLKQDMETIEAMYHQHGYLDANVSLIGLKQNRRGNFTDIYLKIMEGSQYTFSNIGMLGNSAFSDDELLAITGLKTRSYYTEERVDKAAKAVISHYLQAGYADVAVQAIKYPRLDPNIIDLNMVIEQGALYTIEKVIHQGNFKTKAHVIDRELSFNHGDRFHAEVLHENQEKLYDTGLFSGVMIEGIPSIERPGKMDVLIKLKERKSLVLDLGVDINSDEGLRGYLSLANRNLFGGGHYVGSEAILGKYKQCFALSYADRWFLGRPFRFRADLYYQDDIHESYSAESIGGKITFYRKLGMKTSINLIYNLERVKYYDLAETIIENDGINEHANIGKLKPIYIVDTRNDPFRPTNGFRSSAACGLAASFLGSDTDFYSLEISHSHFVSAFNLITLAGSISLGSVDAFKNDQEPPISELFFLGGYNTVRGYERDMLGPKDDESGDPLGGKSSLVMKLELRFPIWQSLEGVVFYDTGNAWLDSWDYDLGDLRSSIGGGLRYVTPIGPLSIEYAAKTRRESGESAGEFYLSLGYPF